MFRRTLKQSTGLMPIENPKARALKKRRRNVKFRALNKGKKKPQNENTGALIGSNYSMTNG